MECVHQCGRLGGDARQRLDPVAPEFPWPTPLIQLSETNRRKGDRGIYFQYTKHGSYRFLTIVHWRKRFVFDFSI